MSGRSGSADSVVFPVPERPKNNATSPPFPTLAEQCIGNTPLKGRRKLSTVKIDFLTSPAYFVPPIRTIFLVKFKTTNASERVPSRCGSARNEGA